MRNLISNFQAIFTKAPFIVALISMAFPFFILVTMSAIGFEIGSAVLSTILVFGIIGLVIYFMFFHDKKEVVIKDHVADMKAYKQAYDFEKLERSNLIEIIKAFRRRLYLTEEDFTKLIAMLSKDLEDRGEEEFTAEEVASILKEKGPVEKQTG